MLARLSLFLLLPLALAAGPILTLDMVLISVQDDSEGMRVVVPVPMTLLRTASVFVPDRWQMETVPELARYHGSILKLLDELVSMEDGDLVSVREEGSRVDVRKSGGDLIVRVNEGSSRVYAKLPIRAARRVIRQSADGRITPRDVMFALDGALAGKVIDVQDEGTRVKVWAW